MEHLYKLKRKETVVGYMKIVDGLIFMKSTTTNIWGCLTKQVNFGGFVEYRFAIDEDVIDELCIDSVHPFVTKDRKDNDIFDKDEVLVYKGNKNIGEGYIFFNKRFLWWTVNNSNSDNDRESPEDWSQLSLCDVEIEIIDD